MNDDMTPSRPQQASDLADRLQSVATIDPGLGAYQFDNLGDAVRFADLMSKAGPMLPEHLRKQPALCLAVTMRAVHWRFDPFALAMETYQAQRDGVIAYQAKVFVAALRTCAGIQLNYRYEGEIEIEDKPVVSANGRKIAARTARGSRRCIAVATIDGQVLEYETPTLDQITIKNSPLWHNDPDQQLAYYAGRGWTRRHRPDVIMGAHDPDEVEEMSRDMRDVTPKATGFAQLAQQARQAASEPNHTPQEATARPDASPEVHDPDPGDTSPTEGAEDPQEREIEPFDMGRAAAEMSGPREAPGVLNDGQVEEWLAGYDSVPAMVR